MVYNITYPSTHYKVIPRLTFQQGQKIIHDKEVRILNSVCLHQFHSFGLQCKLLYNTNLYHWLIGGLNRICWKKMIDGLLHNKIMKAGSFKCTGCSIFSTTFENYSLLCLDLQSGLRNRRFNNTNPYSWQIRVHHRRFCNSYKRYI